MSDMERTGDDYRAAAQRMQERAADTAGQVREQADRGREQLSERTESMAEGLREQAESRGGVQQKVGVKAADAMERTAGYLRENRTDEIWDDIERVARDHPFQALGGAIVAGFIIGRILR